MTINSCKQATAPKMVQRLERVAEILLSNTSNPQIKNLVSKVTIFRFTLAVFCAFL
jgi:hypothetical protein